MIYKTFELAMSDVKDPDKPSRPLAFSKRVEELSIAEAEELPCLLREFNEQMTSYHKTIETNRGLRKIIMEDFHKALAEEYGESMGTVREHYIWERAASESGFYDKETKYSELSEVPH